MRIRSVRRWMTCCPACWIKIDWKSHNVTVNAHTSSMKWNEISECENDFYFWRSILQSHPCYDASCSWNIESSTRKRVYFLGLISHAINPINRRHHRQVKNVRKIEEKNDSTQIGSEVIRWDSVLLFSTVYDDVKMKEFYIGNESQQT